MQNYPEYDLRRKLSYVHCSILPTFDSNIIISVPTFKNQVRDRSNIMTILNKL